MGVLQDWHVNLVFIAMEQLLQLCISMTFCPVKVQRKPTVTSSHSWKLDEIDTGSIVSDPTDH